MNAISSSEFYELLPKKIQEKISNTNKVTITLEHNKPVIFITETLLPDINNFQGISKLLESFELVKIENKEE